MNSITLQNYFVTSYLHIINFSIIMTIIEETLLNPLEPAFTIVIFIHYKIKENCHVLINQFHENFRSETLDCRKIKAVFRDLK